MKYTGEVAESWPFDYELSYIRFAYSDLTVSGDMVSVTVKNIGQYVGKEIVRLYVEVPQFRMLINSSAGAPIRSMQISGGMKGGVQPGMLEMANGHYLRGIWKMITG